MENVIWDIDLIQNNWILVFTWVFWCVACEISHSYSCLHVGQHIRTNPWWHGWTKAFIMGIISITSYLSPSCFACDPNSSLSRLHTGEQSWIKVQWHTHMTTQTLIQKCESLCATSLSPSCLGCDPRHVWSHRVFVLNKVFIYLYNVNTFGKQTLP